MPRVELKCTHYKKSTHRQAPPEKFIYNIQLTTFYRGLKMFEKLRFVALTHDLGKAFSRKQHERVSVQILRMVMPLDYTIMKSSN